MRLFPGLSLVIMVVFCSVTCHAGEPLDDPMLSFQGFMGILNTPTAHVSTEGSIHLLYSDQRENIWRANTNQRLDRNQRQENYLMSIGLFSFFELGGRLTEAPGRARDLSASFKVTSAPFTKDRAFWPVVAAGVQDVGGGANLLQSKYLAISEDLWRFRFSAGYGFDSKRMQGGFGGVEFRAHDWVTLLGEYDTRDTTAGIRLVTPEIWKTPIRLAATLKSTLNHDPEKIDVAVGVTFPLDFRKRAGRTPHDKEADAQAAAQAGLPEPPAPIQPSSPPQTVVTAPSLPAAAAVQTSLPLQFAPVVDASTNVVSAKAVTVFDGLRKQLVAAGFIHVRVGQRVSRELVIEYENTLYNHNELDALGVVAGIVSAASEDFEMLRIVVTRQGIRVAVVSAPLADLRDFMKQPRQGSRNLKDSMAFSYDTGIIDDTYFAPHDAGFPVPNTSLILAPGLQTFVGTEVGVIDYLLSLRPEIVSNLWKGGVFQARWDIPLLWSANFDDGNVLRGSRNDARMDRAMLFQGVNLAPGLMANLGAGMVLHNNYGMLNEFTWSPGQGAHRLRGVQAWARDPDTRRVTEVYLGSYRYQYAPLDLSLEATAGKFWGQDRGFSLELKRFFADTAVSAFYKNSTTAENKHWQAAGIQFAFPLTPRKDLRVGPVQVRGADEWSYSQETTLAVGGQKTNDVMKQALAVNPQPTPALYRSYYNRDRLTGGYIREHLDRLREAWLLYRSDSVAAH